MSLLESQLQASLDKLRKPVALRCEAICKVTDPRRHGCAPYRCDNHLTTVTPAGRALCFTHRLAADNPHRSEPLTYAEEIAAR